MRIKIQVTVLNAVKFIFLMSFLSACSLTLTEQVSQLPKADSEKSYFGYAIAAKPPEGNDYHIRDDSHGNIDYLVFAKAINNASISTAFVQCNRWKKSSDDINVEQTLKGAIIRAKVEHSQNIKAFEYKMSDIVVAGENCKRIDFSGQYKGRSSSYIVGYDIHCIHPTRLNVVRIGTNYVHPMKDSQNILPIELEPFYQNVTFLP